MLEEDVFVEEDLEEDEHLYQVAINFGDPNGSPSQKPPETLEYYDDSDEEDSKKLKKTKSRLPHNPRSDGVDDVNSNLESAQTVVLLSHPPISVADQRMEPSVEVESVQGELGSISILDFAKTISAIDWGSIVQIKVGTAGETAESDKFPYFGKTHKHWLHLLWDSDPQEWVLLQLNSKLEESEENIDELPPSRKLFVRDISEVYLELPPSSSFRVYLSVEQSSTQEEESDLGELARTTSEEEALEAGVSHSVASTDTTPTRHMATSSAYGRLQPNVPIVLRITPEPTVRWHAAMWVDALYAAMQLQIHEPHEEVLDIRSRYYESLPAELTTTGDVDGAEVSLGGVDLSSMRDDRSSVDFTDIYDHRKTATTAALPDKSCCNVS